MGKNYTYLIRIRGVVDEFELNAMSPCAMKLERVDPTSMLFSACTDQSGMIGLMRYLHGMGLVLLSMHCHM